MLNLKCRKKIQHLNLKHPIRKDNDLSYVNFSYEERARSLEVVVQNHKDSTTFEEFAAQIYSPMQTVSPFCSGPAHSAGKFTYCYI